MEDKNIYSVSSFSRLLKDVVSENFGLIQIQGEISSFIEAGSGHWYFDLKDDDLSEKSNAVIKGTVWKPVIPSLSFKPKNGDKVIVSGTVQIYDARSSYQLNVKSVSLLGQGQLIEQFLQLKEKLLKAGYFDPERKKSLPKYPVSIGLITSSKGAVLQDMMHRLQDRYPLVDVYLYPVLVQGQGSAKSIANAIQYYNNFSQKKRSIDFIILARGGGSLEDLWTFNEELVVQAIYDSTLPVVSAVGHETDVTLADFVADLRAPTPTAAIEMTTPDQQTLFQNLNTTQHQLQDYLSGMIQLKTSQLQVCEHNLQSYKESLYYLDQQLDDITEQMGQHLQTKLTYYVYQIQSLQDQLWDKIRIIYKKHQDDLSLISVQMKDAYTRWLQDKKQSLDHEADLLQSYSYTNVLKRGFAMIEQEPSKELDLFEKPTTPSILNSKHQVLQEFKKNPDGLDVLVTWNDGRLLAKLKKR